MTSTDIAIASPTLPTTKTERNAARTAQVGRRVRHAIELMVWEGHPRTTAAELAGMQPKSLGNALRRPQVKRLYLDELEVLRMSERARNIHTLVDVRDQKTNQMARVTAVKALEQLADDEPTAAARSRAPGVVINIIGTASLTPQQRMIEANPLIDNGPRSSSDPEGDE